MSSRSDQTTRTGKTKLWQLGKMLVAICKEFEDIGPAAQHYDSNGHVQGHLGLEIYRCQGRFILAVYYTYSPCIERNNLQRVLLDFRPPRPRWRVLTLKKRSLDSWHLLEMVGDPVYWGKGGHLAPYIDTCGIRSSTRMLCNFAE